MENIWYILFLLFSVGVAILIYYKRKFFAYLSVLFSGIERISLYFGFTLTPLLIIGVIGVPMTWGRQEARKVKLPKMLLMAVLVILGSGFLSTIFSPFRSEAVKAYVYIVIFFAILLAEYITIKLLPNIEQLFMFVGIGLVGFSSYAIIQYIRFTHGLYPDILHVSIPHNISLSPLDFVGGVGFRPNSGFNDVNTSAGFILLYLPLLIVLTVITGKKYLADKTKKHASVFILYLIASITSIYALFLMNSRSILLGVIFIALAVCIMLFIRFKNKRRFLVIFFTLFFLFSVGFAFMQKEKISSAISVIYQDQSSTQAHIVYTQSGLREFASYPILGGGIGSFSEFFQEEQRRGIVSNLYTSVDNPPEYIKIMAEEGVFGLLAYLFLFFTSIWVLVKSALKTNLTGDFLIATSLLLGFVGILGANFFHAYLSLYFFAVFLSLVWVFGIKE